MKSMWHGTSMEMLKRLAARQRAVEICFLDKMTLKEPTHRSAGRYDRKSQKTTDRAKASESPWRVELGVVCILEYVDNSVATGRGRPYFEVQQSNHRLSREFRKPVAHIHQRQVVVNGTSRDLSAWFHVSVRTAAEVTHLPRRQTVLDRCTRAGG
jgi:hypothetical protein